ncbi:S-adenosyl-L-methionine-dependent methyltransferase [Hypoxylon rubiginosum]|uniref:S-adenosyl-L-methionine-dependent methyltransferase n=1 Tax=Hypoxylon rubiginosum TaxID=110542 RepID=A0ACC0CK24_9PEZI|nr:S-adenosyl-L-methionine-dependent methyltransferase [Hypoxylon rubiginosum]
MTIHKPAPLDSAVSLLERLVIDPSAITSELRSDDQLRKRLLSAIQKLVPELETPVEACQRVLYNALELPMARVAIDLNVLNNLKESPSPLTTEDLANKSGKSPNHKLLARILRYLASLSLIREVDTDMWTASRFGNDLSGRGQSAGVCHMVDNCFAAMITLPAFLRRHEYNPPETEDDTAFAQANRVGAEEKTFFDWLKTRPQNAKDFNVFMGSHRTGMRTWLDRPEVIDEITSSFKKVTAGKEGGEEKGVSFVDIGGNIGHQCKAFKQHVPDLKGTIVLEDLEEVIANAELEDGIEKVAVNFLEGQPVKGAASYYFRSVLRNWSDPYSRIILGHVRDAMAEDSLLLIDELVLPDRGAHRYETQLDLTMLAMLNAEARTETHWKQLLSEVGLEVKSIVYYEDDAREAVIMAKKAAI